jgi:uncharacterized protein YqhQ
MNKYIELLMGLILVILPILVAVQWANWGQATLQFLMGGVIVLVVLIGLLFVMLGISDMKE